MATWLGCCSVEDGGIVRSAGVSTEAGVVRHYESYWSDYPKFWDSFIAESLESFVYSWSRWSLETAMNPIWWSRRMVNLIKHGRFIGINPSTVESLKADLQSKEAQIESTQESIKQPRMIGTARTPKYLPDPRISRASPTRVSAPLTCIHRNPGRGSGTLWITKKFPA